MALQRKKDFYSGLYSQASDDEELDVWSGGFELEVVSPKKRVKTSRASQSSRSSEHEGENQPEPSEAPNASAAKRAKSK